MASFTTKGASVTDAYVITVPQFCICFSHELCFKYSYVILIKSENHEIGAKEHSKEPSHVHWNMISIASEVVLHTVSFLNY